MAYTAPSKEVMGVKSLCEEGGVEQAVLLPDVLLGNHL